MGIQISILGLGQIGSSIGLVLGENKDQIHRVGHDKSQEAVRLAKEKNAIDKVAITLSGAVKDADVVILALPFQEIYPVLEHISQDDIAGALAAAVIYNQENTSRVLNDFIRTLVEIRDLSETADQEKLEDLFTNFQKERDLWWADRRESRWIDFPKRDIPRSSFLAQLFGFGRRKPPREDKDR